MENASALEALAQSDSGPHPAGTSRRRRFNFETVSPIREPDLEITPVRRECERMLADSAVPLQVERDVIALLASAFHDLREGEGIQAGKPGADHRRAGPNAPQEGGERAASDEIAALAQARGSRRCGATGSRCGRTC